ncbi:hypothetical protein Srubr_29690 [Streptomyces rubradiris]|uniref:Uncharacterized protein n=1 Tax=Streptomyces rubradiris TaxID=285531 RepID=A0ABQ3RB99_STRRR|nr:hypothetical protein GCM10018792_52570 [Streptomyces rubradiris]GHI53123.1 hypothetical protein Srubr_29690 [Streptomyces rubradiris]
MRAPGPRPEGREWPGPETVRSDAGGPCAFLTCRPRATCGPTDERATAYQAAPRLTGNLIQTRR